LTRSHSLTIIQGCFVSPFPSMRVDDSFEHARLVLLQYQKCKPIHLDGTVDIPIAVESLYGFVLGKLHGKYEQTWTPRIDVDIDSEEEIESFRSLAVSSVLTKSFRRSAEISEPAMRRYGALAMARRAAMRPASRLGLRKSVRAQNNNANVQAQSSPSPSPTANVTQATLQPEMNPTSDSDCGINAPGSTWQFRRFPFSPIVDNREHCCAYACSALLATVGVSPTTLMMDTCCSTCNKAKCAPADSRVTAAIALMTVLNVPNLLTANVTTVSIDVGWGP
jgi:hypothetical protein